MKHFGPCPKCGQGGISIPKVKYKPLSAPLKSVANYCSKCGKTLVTQCYACNGTGKKTPLYVSSLLKLDRYCSECGRELEPPDDTCPSCGGEGEIYDTSHICI